MEKADHLLIVDDDEEIRDLLKRYLEKSGFKVSVAANGRQMRNVLAMGGIDLIVLDLMMPHEDGLSLCRELTATQVQPVPILMLTARNEEADRILGLEMGADDYLTKPFATRELLARIRAILRRARMIPIQLRETSAGRRLGFGIWILDTNARHLIDASGAIVSLSGAEYRLLRVFLDHPQRVLTRDQLLNLTQNRDADYFDRSIDILVSRLRKRLRDDSREPQYIKTLRSEGYIFSSTVEHREDVS
ncbi:response regulator [Undibacterium sp. Di27W]|uniref:response regulator n=1 Tax=Undibacterium sp. Di27W TaxID=3413036 RepID=UPI003BF455B1